MSRFAMFLILVVCGVILLAASPVMFWWMWDGYYAPRAEQAVAAASNVLARGETPPNVTFYPTVDRSALGRSFASGWRVSGHDAILLSLNGCEIKVRVHGDGQYNFDANRFDGSWHLTCCSHWSEEEIRERETSRR
jgi:hypothetical protein